MLSQRKTLIAAACGTAALLAAIPAMAGGGGWHGRGGPGSLMIIETFDIDKDGKVTQAEIDQTRKDQLAKYDSNHDGVLSLEEYQALWLDAMRRMMVRQFQANDADGDGRITVEEFTARFDDLVRDRDRDRNGDGVLTADELRPRGHGPHHGPGPGRSPGPGPDPDDDDQ